MRSIGLRRPHPGARVPAHRDPFTLPPSLEFRPEPVREVERDLIIPLLCEQVLGPQPDNSVSALLKVTMAHADVEHRGMDILPVFQATIVGVNGRTLW